MKITLVVAAALNNAIGKNNRLLWHLPNDLKHFKNLTWGLPVLMGRKTFDSVGRPLKGRPNLILTRSASFEANGCTVVHDIHAAICFCRTNLYNELMIVGGSEIYDLFLPLADSIQLTRVFTNPEADTFFNFDMNGWELKKQTSWRADEKHAFDYNFEEWQKQNPQNTL